MSGRASARLAWAVEALDVQPDERVLELGCGHGVALALVCDRLGPDGAAVGVDRSATMTAAAARRTAGRARLVTAPLADPALGDERFPKVLAVHFPPLLRGDPARELTVIAAHLAPGGTLHVVAQPLSGPAEAVADEIRARLEPQGFGVRDVRADVVEDRPIVAVVAAHRTCLTSWPLPARREHEAGPDAQDAHLPTA